MPRSDNWSHEETSLLIALWSEAGIQKELGSSYKKKKIFEKIAAELVKNGHLERSADQCRVKMKNLRTIFKKTLDNNEQSANPKKYCAFYKELEVIMRNEPAAHYDALDDTVLQPHETSVNENRISDAMFIQSIKTEIDSSPGYTNGFTVGSTPADTGFTVGSAPAYSDGITVGSAPAYSDRITVGSAPAYTNGFTVESNYRKRKPETEEPCHCKRAKTNMKSEFITFQLEIQRMFVDMEKERMKFEFELEKRRQNFQVEQHQRFLDKMSNMFNVMMKSMSHDNSVNNSLSETHNY